MSLTKEQLENKIREGLKEYYNFTDEFVNSIVFRHFDNMIMGIGGYKHTINHATLFTCRVEYGEDVKIHVLSYELEDYLTIVLEGEN